MGKISDKKEKKDVDYRTGPMMSISVLLAKFEKVLKLAQRNSHNFTEGERSLPDLATACWARSYAG
jgi:hypothetical protein